MTKYTITPRVRELIDTCDLTSEQKDKFVHRKWISHSDIINLYKLRKIASKHKRLTSGEEQEGVRVKEEKGESLLSFLKGAQIYKEPEIKPPKSPEFLKQMERLRLKEQEQEYRRLVRGNPESSVFKINAPLPGKSGKELEEEEELLATGGFNSAKIGGVNKEVKELRHQVTTIFNILISVVSVAYAVWYWTGTSMRVNDGIRVLISLFFALLVLVAEVVVFGGYLKRIEDAKITERSKSEERQVVDTVVFTKR